jgi:hypothetical protein
MADERKQVGTLLDAALYRQIRALALLQGRQAGELIDEAMKDYLAKHNIPAKSGTFKRTK